MSYTTVTRVRSESGFTGNTDISDTYIGGYLTQATGVLQSYIFSVYDGSKLSGALFTGSQAENMLKRIEELLASGYLLISEYGIEALNTDKDGYTKVKEATKLLDQIISGDLRLFDINSSEFTKKTTASAGGIVMSTPSNNPNLTPIFTTTQIF